jgi:uncharacterized RmlC-like cupin family protein
MERFPGIAPGGDGASKVWMGLVTCLPNDKGPPHHHGEAETAAYVLSGHVRVYYGEDFEEFVEAGPGDFLFVPSHIHHIETNPYAEPTQLVLARAPDNIVVNLAK